MEDPRPTSERPLTRGDLERLHREGTLDAAAFTEALSLWDRSRDWRGFATRWLTILGAAFLLIGILFFFAYNWKDLGRLTRFAILQGAVVLTALAAAWNLRGDVRSLAGELLLIAASVLTGILIAVYGQAYQTGADAFQNFLGWGGLIIPWVLVSRNAPHWVLWFAIVQTGIIFYWTQVMGPTDRASFAVLFPLLGLLTLAAAIARELLAARKSFTWLDHRAIRYLFLTATLAWLGISSVRFIFFDEYKGPAALDALGLVLFAASVAATFWWHRLRDYDLGALLIATLFSATVILIALGRLLFEGLDGLGGGIFLLLAMITLGVYGGAGVLLQKIHRAHHETPSP